jgi:tRNA A37 threonylcarbamoyladenosine synthetase subunit TsaC/SUA5/YrdC
MWTNNKSETAAAAQQRPRVIPGINQLPNHRRDAREAFEVLQAGGVVIIPTDVGYGIVSSTSEGIERAFAAKRRKPGHTLGVVGSYAQHAELHILGDTEEEHRRKLDLTAALTVETGGLVAFVARYRRDHPRLQVLSKQTLERVTKGDTLGIAIPESPFLTELGRLNDATGSLMVGSSANLSGQGQKFRVEDIEQEVLEAADLVVDYGLQKYHLYERAGTILDVNSMKVLRIGAAYEIMRERVFKWTGLELPEDPDYKSGDGFKRTGKSIKLDNE